MVVCSTSFHHFDIHIITCLSLDQFAINQFNHIVIYGRHVPSVLGIGGIRGSNTGWGHYLVVLVLATEYIANVRRTKGADEAFPAYITCKLCRSHHNPDKSGELRANTIRHLNSIAHHNAINGMTKSVEKKLQQNMALIKRYCRLQQQEPLLKIIRQWEERFYKQVTRLIMDFKNGECSCGYKNENLVTDLKGILSIGQLHFSSL